MSRSLPAGWRRSLFDIAMRDVALTLILLPVAAFLWAYAGYPIVLRLAAPSRVRSRRAEQERLPFITITVPCYNEARSIGQTLDALLALDYPADRRQIVVISDASTDETDDIVRSYASRGVELLRLPTRGGKSAAENAAGAVVRGEIVVNIDATIRLLPDSLRALVSAFADPQVGVASGRDVSVAPSAADANGGEQGYVGYEMWVRGLETRIHSIVGASGCFYAIRTTLYDSTFPESLSRDFASALIAREHGYRAVSVDDAICIVPRARALRAELRRKVRTMARGLQTLWYKRALMNPRRYGVFAFMLASHKLCRWLVYLTLPLALLGVLLLSATSSAARVLLVLGVLGLILGVAGMRWPEERRAPAPIALCGFALASALAGVLAWVTVFRGERNSIWEPTRRTA